MPDKPVRPRPRPRVVPPRQERSARTLERIVAAFEQLLRTRPFEAVTVRDIVAEAGCPIASFYARFTSKDDLLPHLYARYDADVAPRVDGLLSTLRTADLALEDAALLAARFIVESYARDRWLMREVALYARRQPASIGEDVRRERVDLHARAAAVFGRFTDRIAHPNPVRAAEVGIFIIGATAREAVLFGDAPHAAATALDLDALTQALTHTLVSFLRTPCEPPHRCCSPPPSPSTSPSRARRG